MSKAHTLSTHEQHCIITHQCNQPIPADTPIVIGVDEVGRGSLFGQMSVSAVILPAALSKPFTSLDLSATPLASVGDSKKLTEKQRNLLNPIIRDICHGFVIVDIPAFVIDAIDIYQATLLGMRLAIQTLIIKHNISPHQLNVLIDGNATPMLSNDFLHYQPCLQTIIKGDGIHSSIACASILAKVHRDTAMMEYAKQYPEYAIDKHKGYASQKHRHAIHSFGILPEHRKSFNPMREILANQHDTNTSDTNTNTNDTIDTKNNTISNKIDSITQADLFNN
ncbi:MAG: ribonuclease HII [Moraxella sp.]|nr:ribonuclease HII [Moraxella sp.]